MDLNSTVKFQVIQIIKKICVTYYFKDYGYFMGEV